MRPSVISMFDEDIRSVGQWSASLLDALALALARALADARGWGAGGACGRLSCSTPRCSRSTASPPASTRPRSLPSPTPSLRLTVQAQRLVLAGERRRGGGRGQCWRKRKGKRRSEKGAGEREEGGGKVVERVGTSEGVEAQLTW
eukprot:14717-Rhodomonas_salina.1